MVEREPSAVRYFEVAFCYSPWSMALVFHGNNTTSSCSPQDTPNVPLTLTFVLHNRLSAAGWQIGCTWSIVLKDSLKPPWAAMLLLLAVHVEAAWVFVTTPFWAFCLGIMTRILFWMYQWMYSRNHEVSHQVVNICSAAGHNWPLGVISAISVLKSPNPHQILRYELISVTTAVVQLIDGAISWKWSLFLYCFFCRTFHCWENSLLLET